MERYKLKTLLMSDEDLRVLQEVLCCAAEGKPLTISVSDRERTRRLYEQMVERFGGEERSS